MRTRYKNKRDQFKAEAETNKRSAEFWEEQARKNREEFETYKRTKIEQEKKRYSAIVFCGNCHEVHSVLIPPEVEIEKGDCVNCRVRGQLKLVTKVNT